MGSASYFVIIEIRWNTDIGHHKRSKIFNSSPCFIEETNRLSKSPQQKSLEAMRVEPGNRVSTLDFMHFMSSQVLVGFSGVTIVDFPTVLWDRDNLFLIIAKTWVRNIIWCLPGTNFLLHVSMPTPGGRCCLNMIPDKYNYWWYHCKILCQPYLWDTPHDGLSHTHRLDYLPTVSHRSSIEFPTRWLNTMGLKKVKQYLNSPFLIIRPFRWASRHHLAIKVGENVQFMKYHVCSVRPVSAFRLTPGFSLSGKEDILRVISS